MLTPHDIGCTPVGATSGCDTPLTTVKSRPGGRSYREIRPILVVLPFLEDQSNRR
jgi:hypothetical protein